MPTIPLDRQCAVSGCEEHRLSRGWCSRHYQRWKRYGDPAHPVKERAGVWQQNRPTGPAIYGLTAADFEALWTKQNGECAICRQLLERRGMRSCNIDHCHKTGRVRGLLCRRCNRGIGMLGDDPDRLEVATRYLRD